MAKIEHVQYNGTTYDIQDPVVAGYFTNEKLDIQHGGTGASTAADARTNLGVPDIDSTVMTVNQSLTTAQKEQVYENLDLHPMSVRDIPFSITVGHWSLSDGVYTAEFVSSYITDTSKEIPSFDDTFREYGRADIVIEKKNGGGGAVFTTNVIPTGTITGKFLVIDNDDGQVPVLIEDTVIPIAKGGTGQSTLAGAQQALGMNAKIDKPTNIEPGKYLQTDAYGNAVWGGAASDATIATSVTAWLTDNVPTGTTVVIDKSLTVEDAAADAKAVGTRFDNMGLSVVNGKLCVTYEGAT